MPRGRSGFRLPTRGMWKNTGFRPDAMLPSVSALARHQSVTVISLPHADNACKLYLLLASLSLPAPSDPTPVFSLSRRGVPRGRNQIEFDLIAKNKKLPDIPYHHTRGSTAFALVLFCNHKYRSLCACFLHGLVAEPFFQSLVHNLLHLLFRDPLCVRCAWSLACPT